MLHIQSSGIGPDVVFLHGTPTTTDIFDGVVAELARGCRCHVVHLPGYGGSPAPTLPVTLEALHAALEATLKNLGGEPMTLVGFSSGAWHALALALGGRLPVVRVALLAGAAELASEEREGSRQFAAALRAGADLKPLAALRFLGPGSQADPARRASVEAWLDAAPREVIASELEAFAGAPSLLDDLSRLEVPVLARVGAADVATPVVKSQAIASRVKRATLQIVPEVGHALPLEDGPGCAAALAAFITGA
ncbi:MAG: alpha/beta hydrolase [Polyangiaceae bacterium]